MAYDLVRQRYPGAPCAIGARVIHRDTGRHGSIAPPRAGTTGLCVRFDGAWPPEDCHPRDLEYLRAPVIALGDARRSRSAPNQPESQRP